VLSRVIFFSSFEKVSTAALSVSNGILSFSLSRAPSFLQFFENIARGSETISSVNEGGLKDSHVDGGHMIDPSHQVMLLARKRWGHRDQSCPELTFIILCTKDSIEVVLDEIKNMSMSLLVDFACLKTRASQKNGRSEGPRKNIRCVSTQ
jgi:hypothetical protein